MSAQPPDVHDLAAIIAAFDASTAKLKASHDALQERIRELTGELSLKNARLSQTLEQVSALKNYLANILESITDGVLAIDLDRRVVALNRTAAAALPGLQPEREGRFILDVLPADCRRLGELLLDCLQRRERITNAEVALPAAGGRERVLSVSVSPICSEGGAVLGAVETFRDLTDLKELERRAARNERLAALGEMSAGVAHEIRNPLGGIELYASNLRRRLPAGSKEEELAAKIIAASASLNQIVTDMLLFTRGREPVKRAAPLEHAVCTALDLAAAELEAKRIEVKRDFGTGGRKLQYDTDQLSRAFLNIILNAARILEPGGRLEIATLLDGNGAVARFADDGPGVPEHAKDKLFNPFFTLRKDGTGLGLAIVHKIVHDHGGTVAVSDNRPRGAVFEIRLPV